VWFGDEAGTWHYESIESLVESRLDDPREDDFGALTADVEEDLTVPSIDDQGRTVQRRITAVSKHPSPDHLVRIETRSGRELTVTPDHSMRRWRDGVERLEAHQLEVGDEIPSPKSLSFDGDVASFDLLERFLPLDSISNDELMIRGLGGDRIRQFFEEATSEPGYLKPVANRLGLSDSTVYNWVHRDSVPASAFVSLFGPTETVSRLPDDIELGIRRDGASVDRWFRVDESVATVLGYYAAEGFLRREPGGFYQTTICVPDEVARDRLVDVFDDRLSVTAFEENEWKVTVSSKLVAALFEEVLEVGESAAGKRVPGCITAAPDSVARAFLAAYFAGDGSASTDRIEIRAHTVSDGLKDGVVGLLKRFGIASKTYREARTPSTGAVAEFYGDDAPEFESWVVKITSENAARFADRVGFHLPRKQATLESAIESSEVRTQRLFGDGGDVWLDEISAVEYVQSDVEYTYSLTVEETNALVANDLHVGQCDGDEDCVMLLMDGLLNFSKEFLPDKRGGQMDAPLVMSSRIDPSEIDDEAHNMDIVRSYPREFYEATREMADPGDVDIRVAEDTLDTDDEYRGFDHTHDTSDIALGPDLSAYKTLGSMMDKMDAQLALARKLRAVDETDVAERVIEYHFLPDLIGNLRAFSRQETRCLDCGEKYRRMPLTGECRECGGRVNLTVHQGSVNKYMDTAIRVAEEFGCRDYTKQRLEVLERSLSSIFENDKNKQSGIADFM
jgi:DNA polymerase II large subunit